MHDPSKAYPLGDWRRHPRTCPHASRPCVLPRSLTLVRVRSPWSARALVVLGCWCVWWRQRRCWLWGGVANRPLYIKGLKTMPPRCALKLATGSVVETVRETWAFGRVMPLGGPHLASYGCLSARRPVVRTTASQQRHNSVTTASQQRASLRECLLTFIKALGPLKPQNRNPQKARTRLFPFLFADCLFIFGL